MEDIQPTSRPKPRPRPIVPKKPQEAAITQDIAPALAEPQATSKETKKRDTPPIEDDELDFPLAQRRKQSSAGNKKGKATMEKVGSGSRCRTTRANPGG